MRFRITTPKNPTYNGKTYGVQFNDGVAIVDGPPGKRTRYDVQYRDLPRLFTELGLRHKLDPQTEHLVVDVQPYVVEMLEDEGTRATPAPALSVPVPVPAPAPAPAPAPVPAAPTARK